MNITSVFTNNLSIAAGRTNQLSAFARTQLNVVYNSTNRHILQRHSVTRFNICFFGRNDFITGFQALWSQNISLFAVAVIYQSDKCSTVRIIFDSLNCSLTIKFITFKINHTIAAFVTATDTTTCNVTIVITPTGLAQTFCQTLLRFALVQFAFINEYKLATAGRSGLKCIQSHN